MSHGDPARQERAVLRVKRKRLDDPVDAFLFQLREERMEAKRQRDDEAGSADIPLRPDAGPRGMFRRQSTVESSALQQDTTKHIIEAEWDAQRHRMKLKRKYNHDEEGAARHDLDRDVRQKMGVVTDMLSQYLQCSLFYLHQCKTDTVNSAKAL